jgi:hypothetical protein
MATAMINVRVGCIGAGQRDIDRILGIHSFVTDMAEYGAIPLALDDPLWTWNAPFFLTGQGYGIEAGAIEMVPSAPGEDHTDLQPSAAEKIENVRLYFESLEQYESTRGGRTDYLIVFFFDVQATNGQMKELVNSFLGRSFPKARAFAAVHRNTGCAQVHVYLDSRQTDRRRIELKNRQFKTLDETWARLYANFVGPNNVYTRHKKKEGETRARKRAAAGTTKGDAVPGQSAIVETLPERRVED